MKKNPILFIILAALAMTIAAHAQCTSGAGEIRVMCIKGDEAGGGCQQMGVRECCSGMGHTCMSPQGTCHSDIGGCDMHFYLCCAGELELSEVQTKRLKAIRFEHQKSTIRMKADLEIRALELEELMGQTAPDRSAVSRKVAEMGELTTKMKTDHILSRLDARSVLTEKQLGKCMNGHCGCCSMGAKKIIEQSSCSKEEPCKATCTEEDRKCSHGK